MEKENPKISPIYHMIARYMYSEISNLSVYMYMFIWFLDNHSWYLHKSKGM